MPIRQFRPVTASSRFRSVPDFSEITREEPEKSLVEPLKKSGGRDNHGHISMRRRGGGHKRKYRIIDFRRDKFGVTATVREIEYDPNRSARIALVEYADGERRYILHPKGLKVGDSVVSGPGSDIRTGNTMPLAEVPLGTAVHNIELKIGKGGQLCRSAGMAAPGGAKEGEDGGAGCGEGGRVGGGAHAVDGDAHDSRPLPGDDRRDRQRGARAALVGQGGEDALDGASSQGARRGDEPR